MAAKSTFRLLLVLMALAAGCSSKPSMSTWQRGVERYVADRGDPSALRDVTVSGTRRGFAVIGGVDPKKSTDVNAVLLGHKDINGQPWFIYLAGLVNEQKVADIHLAAVSFAGDRPRWVISQKDGRAVAAYRQFNAAEWREAHGTHARTPSSYTAFPRDVDEFSLTINGTRVEAQHAGSGARWTLDLKAVDGKNAS